MTLPLDTIDSRVPTVCRMLRTKTAFGTHFVEGEAEAWQTGESTTAVYWCLCTMDPTGPDDDFAHPSQCRSARSCYRAPLE
jgi:hypothetical protein